MAFESLSEKLQNVFKNLRGKGRLTEADVKAALKEVKIALLEADVNFKVVKNFVKSVQERAIGQDVMNGLNPGQMVIKIVNEELVSLMGSETTEIALLPGNQVTVIMMIGLQGAGKTTTAAKIAGKLKMKADSRFWLLVIFIVRRQSSSWKLTVKNRVLRCSRWEQITVRLTLQRQQSSMQRITDKTWSSLIPQAVCRLMNP